MVNRDELVVESQRKRASSPAWSRVEHPFPPVKRKCTLILNYFDAAAVWFCMTPRPASTTKATWPVSSRILRNRNTSRANYNQAYKLGGFWQRRVGTCKFLCVAQPGYIVVSACEGQGCQKSTFKRPLLGRPCNVNRWLLYRMPVGGETVFRASAFGLCTSFRHFISHQTIKISFTSQAGAGIYIFGCPNPLVEAFPVEYMLLLLTLFWKAFLLLRFQSSPAL